MRLHLEAAGYWKKSDEEELIKKTKEEILSAFLAAEKEPKPSVDTLFTDVYDELPRHLQVQEQQLKKLLLKYPNLPK
jgi:2-oxoisovalerate dehydrogenase E1 component alpha subunit